MTSGAATAAADREHASTYALAAGAGAPCTEVVTIELPVAEALASGATGNFEEKYGSVVRVVRMGGEAAGDDGRGAFSRELCGGTHVSDVREVCVRAVS